jgi:hypothetical protein
LISEVPEVSEQPGLYADADYSIPAVFAVPEFGVNANGETYGSAMGVSFANMPDLTLAAGDNGLIGYIRTSESIGAPPPSSPEEAIRIQEEWERNGSPPRVYNLYLSDGVTVIDTFTTGNR